MPIIACLPLSCGKRGQHSATRIAAWPPRERRRPSRLFVNLCRRGRRRSRGLTSICVTPGHSRNRAIEGRYAMLSRQDNENIFLMFSDDLHFWRSHTIIIKPTYAWEFVQLGNCGSPIETERGSAPSTSEAFSQ